MTKKLTLLLITCIIMNFLYSMAPVKAYSADNSKYIILVDMTELRLYLYNQEIAKIIKTYPIAGGKPETPSPIGTWKIISKSSDWGGGFGTRWMALNIPWGKYGIHGTNKPLTIGGPDSQGCIRMFNNDVEDLYKRVKVETIVIIYGGPCGLQYNAFRVIVPGYRGADVYEIQKKLKEKGYFPGNIDGIYGVEMQKWVLKFRKDNNLKLTYNIDREFYNALDIKAFE